MSGVSRAVPRCPGCARRKNCPCRFAGMNRNGVDDVHDPSTVRQAHGLHPATAGSGLSAKFATKGAREPMRCREFRSPLAKFCQIGNDRGRRTADRREDKDSAVVGSRSRSASKAPLRPWATAHGTAHRTQPRERREHIGVGTAHWFAPPLPPNRTCGFPASGSPVGS